MSELIFVAIVTALSALVLCAPYRCHWYTMGTPHRAIDPDRMPD